MGVALLIRKLTPPFLPPTAPAAYIEAARWPHSFQQACICCEASTTFSQLLLRSEELFNLLLTLNSFLKSVVSEMVNWADTDQTIFDSQIAQLKWQLQNSCFSDYLSIAKEDSVRVVSEDTLKGEGRGLITRKVDTEKPHYVCADMVDNDEIKKRKKNSVKADDISKNSHCKSKKENLGEKSNSMEREPPQKTQYIHVRARRGQATDSHSLAERVRREKISERMKYLQDLVPGCNRITGKASMLDEIINYVQSLQKQVEFLSMKLAAADPQVRRDILQSQSFLGKEINSYSSTSNPRNIASYLLTNPSQQESASHCDLSVNSTNLTDQLAFHKVLPDACVEPCFDVCGTSSWTSTEQELCNLDYTEGGESSMPFYLFQIENDLPII